MRNFIGKMIRMSLAEIYRIYIEYDHLIFRLNSRRTLDFVSSDIYAEPLPS